MGEREGGVLSKGEMDALLLDKKLGAGDACPELAAENCRGGKGGQRVVVGLGE
jgi:hypothetical protein